MTVLWPEVTEIRPAAPLRPEPTVMLIAPDLPPVDTPDPIEIDPVLPILAVPELKTS